MLQTRKREGVLPPYVMCKSDIIFPYGTDRFLNDQHHIRNISWCVWKDISNAYRRKEKPKHRTIYETSNYNSSTWNGVKGM